MTKETTVDGEDYDFRPIPEECPLPDASPHTETCLDCSAEFEQHGELDNICDRCAVPYFVKKVDGLQDKLAKVKIAMGQQEDHYRNLVAALREILKSHGVLAPRSGEDRMNEIRSRNYVVATCAECHKDFPPLEPCDGTCGECRIGDLREQLAKVKGGLERANKYGAQADRDLAGMKSHLDAEVAENARRATRIDFLAKREARAFMELNAAFVDRGDSQEDELIGAVLWACERLKIKPPTTVFEQITAERQRQDDEWVVQDHPAPIWHLILSEEVGEVAQIILHAIFDEEPYTEELINELTQVAAVCVAWLEKLEEDKPER